MAESNMTWADVLELGPTQIAAHLGCPVTTAHAWIRRSGPPAWQIPLYLSVIEKKTRPKRALAAAQRRPKK